MRSLRATYGTDEPCTMTENSTTMKTIPYRVAALVDAGEHGERTEEDRDGALEATPGDEQSLSVT